MTLTLRDHPGVVLEGVGIGHEGAACLDEFQVVDDLLGQQELLGFISDGTIYHIHELLFSFHYLVGLSVFDKLEVCFNLDACHLHLDFC